MVWKYNTLSIHDANKPAGASQLDPLSLALYVDGWVET